MPKISQFFAPPHFHAKYGGYEGVIGLDPVRLIQGNLPPRVLGLVIEWATMYSTKLGETWDAASKGQPLQKIPPLE